MPLPLQAQFDAWTEAHAHTVHQVSPGVLFGWLGVLKQFGHDTTTTLLAHTIYWGEPGAIPGSLGDRHRRRPPDASTAPAGGAAAAGEAPRHAPRSRPPPQVTFAGSPLVPTAEGQYLLKDLALFGAALVIAEASIRRQRRVASSLPLRAPQPD